MKQKTGQAYNLTALTLALVLLLAMLPASAATANDPIPQDALSKKGVLYADSAEDLGVKLPIYSTAGQDKDEAEPYGDIDEYLLETEYFIFDESLQGYLFQNIAPPTFRVFMERMDLLYDAMVDLTGGVPYGGAKITITSGGDGDHGLQWIYGNRPYIYWNLKWIGYILGGIQEDNANDWWFRGTAHELGHLFDGGFGDLWTYNGEGLASFKAFYAIEKCGGMMNGKSTMTMLTHEGLDDHHDDLKPFIHPLFAEDFDLGWQILGDTFSSYFDLDFPIDEELASGSYKLAEFLTRLVDVASDHGVDINEYWSAGTKNKYQETIDAVANNTSMRIVIGPGKPNAGDQLTLSVYNCPHALTVSIQGIWNATKWERYPGYSNRRLTLAAGDNIGLPIGLTIKEADIGISFGVYITFDGGFWPNEWYWSNTVQAPEEEYARLLLSNTEPLAGDTIGLYWLDDPPEQRAYQWSRSRNNWEWQNINLADAGSYSNRYAAQKSDVNYFLRCAVTDGNGKTLYLSDVSKQVKDNADIAPDGGVITPSACTDCGKTHCECEPGEICDVCKEVSCVCLQEDVIINSVTHPATAKINLTNETIDIPSDFNIQAYSVNGGGKWKKWPTGKTDEAIKIKINKLIPKLFNKNLNLHLSDQLNNKGKPLTKNVDPSTTIKFPAVEARPKLKPKPKLFIGSTTWQLSTNKKLYNKPIGDFEWANTVEGKGKIILGQWVGIPDAGLVKPSVKTTYWVRTKPHKDGGKYIPACKTIKFKVK